MNYELNKLSFGIAICIAQPRHYLKRTPRHAQLAGDLQIEKMHCLNLPHG